MRRVHKEQARSGARVETIGKEKEEEKEEEEEKENVEEEEMTVDGGRKKERRLAFSRCQRLTL